MTNKDPSMDSLAKRWLDILGQNKVVAIIVICAVVTGGIAAFLKNAGDIYAFFGHKQVPTSPWTEQALVGTKWQGFGGGSEHIIEFQKDEHCVYRWPSSGTAIQDCRWRTEGAAIYFSGNFDDKSGDPQERGSVRTKAVLSDNTMNGYMEWVGSRAWNWSAALQ
jgi:hypothetical protein